MPLPPSSKSPSRHSHGRSIYRRVARAIWLWVVPTVLLFLALSWMVEWETERWWFQSLGQSETFNTIFLWRAAAFVIVGGFFATILGLNARYAWRVAAESSAPLGLGPSWDGYSSRRLIPLEDKLGLDRYRGVGTVIAVIIPAWVAGLTASSAEHFDNWLLLFHAQPLGRYDGLWGLDLSFFLFRLPGISIAAAFVFWTLFLTLCLTTLIYIYEEAIELGGRETNMVPAVKLHLGILCALLLACKSVEWRLGALDSQSSGGVAPGYFGYAAAHYRLPALLWGSWLAVPVAALVYWFARQGRARAAFILTMAFPFAVWSAYAIFPAWKHTNQVIPRRMELDSEYLANLTRASLESWRLQPVKELRGEGTPEAFAEATELAKLPAWPPSAVRAELNGRLTENSIQLTAGRPHLEEWLVNGAPRLVYTLALQDSVAGPREQGDGGGKSGLAVVDASRRNRDGSIVVYSAAGLAKDVTAKLRPATAPNSGSDLDAQVNFGEWLAAASDSNAQGARDRSVNEADQGQLKNAQDWAATPSGTPHSVPLDNLWRRILAAWRFQELDLARGNPDTLFWHRRVIQRCRNLAPFFDWSHADPRLVVSDDKRLVWLLDGYVTSRRYPGAAMPPLPGSPFGGSNYVRRAVVATVDARDGATQLYAVDNKEPFTALYRSLFPDLIADWSQMPETPRRQVRQPDAEFTARAAIWAYFHPDKGSRGLPSAKAWSPAFAENASRDGDFAYTTQAPELIKQLGLVQTAAFQAKDVDPRNPLELTGMLLQDSQGQLFSWRPATPISVARSLLGEQYQNPNLLARRQNIVGAMPVAGGVALVTGVPFQASRKQPASGLRPEYYQLTPAWNVLTRDGKLSFDLDNQVPRALSSLSHQFLERWIKHWQAFQSARSAQDWAKMDAAAAELNRLEMVSRQNLPSLKAAKEERALNPTRISR